MNKQEAETLVGHIFLLAYDACGQTTGMGFLQERSGVTLEQIMPKTNPPSNFELERNPKLVWHYSIDYGFGRMMKLSVDIECENDEHKVIMPDREVHVEYQGWGHTYVTYESLYSSAVLSVKQSQQSNNH